MSEVLELPKQDLGPASGFLSKTVQLFIDGEFVDAASGEIFETTNPATGEKLADIALGDAADINKAVDAARQAFDKGPWSKMTPSERQKILYKIGDLILENADELAYLESLDNGKPFSVARAADIPLTADLFHYMAAHARTMEGAIIPVSDIAVPGAEFHAYTLREAIGVIGLITPWNYPLLIAAGWQMAGALAAGNTIVLKPSEVTPLSIMRFAELAKEAGVPDGVINIVPGNGLGAGTTLTEHDLVDKIGFTGSVRTGRSILHTVADGNLKKVTLELGGKSPDIIMDDADLEKAIPGVAMGIFFNQGECCCAGSRLLVHKLVYNEVLEGLKKEAEKIKLGSGQSDTTDMGPVVSQKQEDTIMSYINSGIEEGATLVTGGKKVGEQGHFIEPTIFADVNRDMKIVKEEIFGPVLVVQSFETLEEAIEMANDTEFGLGAGIWTESLANTHQLAKAIKAGTVFVNCYNVFDAATPFGGYKMSGWGRNRGKEAFEAFTETKAVYAKLN
ncbi:aldehyde dehydrogenase family protein [Aquimarina sp. U1-2]|uniref:aldehyde dehydrogenase family protein n=1 Tax=Aquimarina sp. U1-2 TaxID=2823141 RepID=UPI001AED0C5A|nr:aldehyde dehydrogenase family protein [Aquimarina sp. U1-2]MBP2833103.1 aldehyde dehydrogenase family protein [Aquimarina sp. U1-2]